MSDNNLGEESSQPLDPSDASFGQADTGPPDVGDAVSGRARVQRRLAQARTSAREATAKARSAAAARGTAKAAHETGDTTGAGTFGERARAYRVPNLSAAAAVVALLGAVLRRRAMPQPAMPMPRSISDEWQLRAEPTDQ